MKCNVIKKINDDVTLERDEQGLVGIHVKDQGKDHVYCRNIMYDKQFKYFFCDPKGKKYALALINDLLMKSEEDKYVSLEYTKTEFESNLPDGKRCIVDFLVKTNAGDLVHIEVQLRLNEFLMKRMFTYWHVINANSAMPKEGEDYSKCSKVISILLTDQAVFDDDEDYYRSFFLIPVKKDPKTHEYILPKDVSIIQKSSEYGYVSVFEVNKFHDYMLKLSKEHGGNKSSYIKALNRLEKWLLWFSPKTTSDELAILAEDEYFMPIFKRENEYYNSYSDCASYFKEIGAYTVEDYKRDTEAKIARLEEKDKRSQEVIKIYMDKDEKSQAEIKLYKEKDVKSQAEIKLYKEKDERSKAEIKLYKEKDEKSQAEMKTLYEAVYNNLGSLRDAARILNVPIAKIKNILNLK